MFLKLKNTFDMIKWNAPLSLSGVHSQRVLCDQFVDKLRNEFICSWLGRLHDDTKGTCSQKNKLRTYRMFKIRYEMEPYLCFLNNPQYRHYLARFRCSAHKLLVETGRYIGLEFNQRICPHCMEDVETEMHFVCSGCSRRESRNTGASPFSFTISVLGSFTCITQHTRPTALRPIRRTKQLWKVSCSRTQAPRPARPGFEPTF